MKTTDKYNSNSKPLETSGENIAHITLIIFLIVTFITSALYIGIDSFFSK